MARSKDSISLAVNAKQVARILRSETGHNTIFSVQVAGGSEEKAMLKDWQVDPVSGALLHVDLLRIAMDVRMRVRVPVHTFGEPQGVKMQGGVFEMVTREVEIECLPGDIPEEYQSGRERVDDRQAASRGRSAARSGEDEAGDRSDARAGARGDAQEGRRAVAEAAVAAEAAPAEPEVIKKGKKEAEEGEAEGGAEARRRRRKEGQGEVAAASGCWRWTGGSRAARRCANRGARIDATDRWPRQSGPRIRVDAA